MITDEPLYSVISLIFKNIKRCLVVGICTTPYLNGLPIANFEFLRFQTIFLNGMMHVIVLVLTRMWMRILPPSNVKLANLRILSLIECELEDIVILIDLKNNLEAFLRHCHKRLDS